MKCLICSGEMHPCPSKMYPYPSNKNFWKCDCCGAVIDDFIVKVNNDKRQKKTESAMGWICTKCGRGVAPWQAYCDCLKTLNYTVGFDRRELLQQSLKLAQKIE